MLPAAGNVSPDAPGEDCTPSCPCRFPASGSGSPVPSFLLLGKTLGPLFPCTTHCTLSFSPQSLPLKGTSGTTTGPRDPPLAASGPPRSLCQRGWVPSFVKVSPLVKATGLGLHTGAGKQSFWVVTRLPEGRIYLIGFQPRPHRRGAWGAVKSHYRPFPSEIWSSGSERSL